MRCAKCTLQCHYSNKDGLLYILSTLQDTGTSPQLMAVGVMLDISSLQSESGSEAHQKMAADKLSVGELAVTKLVTLQPTPICGSLVRILRDCQHQAFPVTPETQQASQIGISPTPTHMLSLHRCIHLHCCQMPSEADLEQWVFQIMQCLKPLQSGVIKSTIVPERWLFQASRVGLKF